MLVLARARTQPTSAATLVLREINWRDHGRAPHISRMPVFMALGRRHAGRENAAHMVPFEAPALFNRMMIDKVRPFAV